VPRKRSDSYGCSSSTYHHPSLRLHTTLSSQYDSSTRRGTRSAVHRSWSQPRRANLFCLFITSHGASSEHVPAPTCAAPRKPGTAGYLSHSFYSSNTAMKIGHYNTRSHALDKDSTHAGQDRYSTNAIWIYGVLKTRPPEIYGNGKFTHTQGKSVMGQYRTHGGHAKQYLRQSRSQLLGRVIYFPWLMLNESICKMKKRYRA
jgi:hypothetical protein